VEEEASPTLARQRRLAPGSTVSPLNSDGELPDGG